MSVTHYANASDLVPLSDYLDRGCGPAARASLFADQGIPTALLYDPNCRIPYADICALYERSAPVCKIKAG